ncbi:MAG: hypothetical protein GY811_31415, partial [Myxococcales bacterium]|nr:hypothetical protein [Myxococcales bacterium]
MEQADTRDDVERMFALANEASHEYHLTRLRDLPPPPPDHPKKKAPTMHGLTPTFEERPAVPRAFPTYGASTIHMNRLRKLHRQLCELRFIGLHHHIDCRAIPPHLAQRIDCTWAAARLLCHKLRPTALLAFPDAWTPDVPAPRGEQLDRLIQNLDSELARRANRAKAERIKIWSEGVREPSGRKAAIYARAADCSPTAYLRTPTTPDDAQLHCDITAFNPDQASTDDSDADTDAGGFSPGDGSSPDTDNDDGPIRGPLPAQVPDALPANAIVANTKDMLKLMVDTWEPILGTYRARAGHDAEAMPTWADFYDEYRQELP